MGKEVKGEVEKDEEEVGEVEEAEVEGGEVKRKRVAGMMEGDMEEVARMGRWGEEAVGTVPPAGLVLLSRAG